MHVIILTFLACGGDSGPTEASARATLDQLRPAVDDIRAQAEAGLDGVSTYETIDCSAIDGPMREMCEAQNAAQKEQGEKQILNFREKVMGPLNRREDVIALGCFRGDEYLGGEPEPPAGSAPETVDIDGLTLGWGLYGEREGIRVSWTSADRRCDLYIAE